MSAVAHDGLAIRSAGTSRVRPVVLWLHRWVGIAMAAFLVIEGVTGAMLAYRGPLTRFFDPGLFSAPPSPTAERLDLATLIEVAEKVAPGGQFHWFLPMDDSVALIMMVARPDPITKKTPALGFGYLALDPWTGREVRRMDAGLYSRHGILTNVMPFVYDLHKSLALGTTGVWILATTALLWTLDCLWALYLTLPRGFDRFLRRWKPAWLIKWRARWQRVNYDVHRASSLWLWIVLLIFAWSSVALLDNFHVYGNTMARLLGPADFPSEAAFLRHSSAEGPPALSWPQALARGESLGREIAARGGFQLEDCNSLWYDDHSRNYSIRFHTSRRFPHERDLVFYFDGDTGAQGLVLSMGNANSTATSWLLAFHMINDPFDYATYRLLVCLFGVMLGVVSVTGVVIWIAKKRRRRPSDVAMT